jgi:hypothetical protein
LNVIAGKAAAISLKLERGAMATSDDFPRSNDEVRCTYHPSVMTRLRCSRCGKPICPRCGVRTPVGLRCPECAGVRGLPTYRTSSDAMAKSVAIGVVVAGLVGIIWGFIPDWNFYLALLLGFSVAEAMALAAKGKRGADLQVAGVLAVLFGLVVSRVIIAQRYDISMADVNAFSQYVENRLYLRLVPDGLFAGLAALIVWYRFR